MAEIPIHPKRSSGWFWALLGILALALILWLLLAVSDADRAAANAVGGEVTEPAVSSVLAWGDERGAAAAIAKDRPLLEQKAQIQRVFDQAAAAAR